MAHTCAAAAPSMDSRRASQRRCRSSPSSVLPLISDRVTHEPATTRGARTPQSPAETTSAQRCTSPSSKGKRFQKRRPFLSRRGNPNSSVEIHPSGARIPVNLRCSQHNIAQIQARFPEGPAYAYLQDQARSCALQQTGQSVGGVGLVIAGLNDDPCPAPRSFGEPAEPPGFPGNRLLPGSFHHAEKGLDLRPGSSKEGNLRLRPLKQAPGIRKRGPQSRSRSIMHPPREGYPGPPGS